MVDNRLKDRLILVVDDEERMVRFIRLNLEHDGFRVVEAYNGSQAIEKVRSSLPDLVLLDVMMPDIDQSGAGSATTNRRYDRGYPRID
jgi:CheY-like chemotaxis protein